MSQVLLAHFKFLHEAEYAKGFLDDAGIRCWLKSDDAAGGAPYIGGLAGAGLIVDARDVERGRAVLDGVGGLADPASDEDRLPEWVPEETSLPPALRADLVDLELELKRARKSEVRHFVWAMFGVSPAAIIPLLGLAREGRVARVALLCVMVVFWEGWRWIQAGREVKRLESAMERLRAELPPGDEDAGPGEPIEA